RYVYYRCSRRRAGIVCREPAVSEAELVRQLCWRLRFLSMPPAIHAWLCRKALAERAVESHREEAVRRTVQQALTGLDREESNLVDMRARETITEGIFST